MLSQTLQRLVGDGLVHRRVESTVPPAVHYSLTSSDRSLGEQLALLRTWSEENMGAIDDHHSAFQFTSAV